MSFNENKFTRLIVFLYCRQPFEFHFGEAFSVTKCLNMDPQHLLMKYSRSYVVLSMQVVWSTQLKQGGTLTQFLARSPSQTVCILLPAVAQNRQPKPERNVHLSREISTRPCQRRKRFLNQTIRNDKNINNAVCQALTHDWKTPSRLSYDRAESRSM